MRLVLALAALASVTALGASSSGAASPSGPAGSWVPGEVLVRFAATAEADRREDALQAVDATVEDRLFVPGLRLVDLGPGVSVTEGVAGLEDSPGVLYAEPNYIDSLEAIPNDTAFNAQWGLRNIGQGVNGTFGVADADIDGPEAWDRVPGAPGVVIGIMDSGVLGSHDDLDGNAYSNPGEVFDGIDNDGNGYIDDFRGYDFFSGDQNPNPVTNDHGTHVAGIAGAEGGNGLGISGVAFDVQLAALKTTNGMVGGGTSIADLVEAIGYARIEGMTAANGSFGSLRAPTMAEVDALTAASNVLFVFSAGNDGIDTDLAVPTHYPSNYHYLPNVISVANTNSSDARSPGSNYGAATVDIGAPGSNIWSTSIDSDTDYTFKGGTSMAAPQVTGAAALLKAAVPGLSAAALKRRILSTVDPTLPGIVGSGGRLNIERMTAPPETTIAGDIVSQGASRGALQAFVVSSSQPETIRQCSIDGEPFGPCNGGTFDSRSYSQGAHTFEARSSFYNLVEPEPARVEFWIDPPNGPKVRIRKGPKGKTTSRSATFKLVSPTAGAPGLRFQCRLDRKRFGTCPRVKRYAKLAPGRHKFRVRAVDRTGPGPSVTRSWRILGR